MLCIFLCVRVLWGVSRGNLTSAHRGPDVVHGAMKPDAPPKNTRTHTLSLPHPLRLELCIKTHVETIRPMPWADIHTHIYCITDMHMCHTHAHKQTSDTRPVPESPHFTACVYINTWLQEKHTHNHVPLDTNHRMTTSHINPYPRFTERGKRLVL